MHAHMLPNVFLALPTRLPRVAPNHLMMTVERSSGTCDAEGLRMPLEGLWR